MNLHFQEQKHHCIPHNYYFSEIFVQIFFKPFLRNKIDPLPSNRGRDLRCSNVVKEDFGPQMFCVLTIL
jgi:hypothetical protein